MLKQPSPARRLWLRWLAGSALAATCLPALAQYQWRDANGRMVFSDQPPPASVKPGQILRNEPMPPAPPPAAPAPSAAKKSDGSPGNGAANSGADPELQRRKRSAEQSEQADREREKASDAARLARACEDARAELRTLDSGMRMARVNKDGEREYLSDDDRDKRSADLQKDLADRCKAG